VVRGTLNLSSTFDCRFPIALQDVSGRNVLTLRPGANDVRHLPAGVYFLRSTVGNRQSKMSRVVIAR
jgi:hypothetical protein